MSDTIIDVEQAEKILKSGAKQAEELLGNNKAIDELIEKVQTKVNEYPLLKTTFEDGKNLLSMLKSYVTKEYTEISPKVIVTVVSALLYLIKQKDLISDKIPVLGLLDDVAIAAVAINFVKPELDKYDEWKAAQPVKTEE